MATTTVTGNEDNLNSSGFLGTSIGSLSSSRQGPSNVSKIYKQASTYFLTRRLYEAFDTLQPLITAQGDEESLEFDEEHHVTAPVAKASRNGRVKVWSLYLTVLDEIVKLGPDEGKTTFGSQRWRGLVKSVQEGKIWEEVLRNGYKAIESEVDPEVITNLTTLLLAHASSQAITQQYLETYLAATSAPSLDLSRLTENGEMASHRKSSPHKSGTNTPRDLNSRLQILELYTLHVLPQNEEWEYAREFINMSEVLDEERREAFLQTLDSLQAESNEIHDQALEDSEKLSHTHPIPMQDAEDSSSSTVKAPSPPPTQTFSHKRRTSEIDYGIEHSSTPKDERSEDRSTQALLNKKSTSSASITPNTSLTSKPSTVRSKRKTVGVASTKKTSTMLGSMRALMLSLSRSLETNPLALLRTLVFLVGLLVALSRREIRDRVRRVLGDGWGKVLSTVGMGVKVSYI